MKKIVSFDFDGTLGHKKEVQEYCKELINKDVEVYITTSRFCEILKHNWQSHPSNKDLWDIVDNLNISHKNVNFLNFNTSKADFLRFSKAIWHLDDDKVEIENFNTQYTIGISVLDSNWKQQCENLLV